ncbi:unnamed protein product [Schistosoma turkestanicum]|nr:unnamed protein product [Schistosoma turkestanicum]CAH8502983.1 unnamed protein product [Schistosoma turkestanicum]
MVIILDIIEETRLKVAVVTKGKNNSPVALIRKMFKRYYKGNHHDNMKFYLFIHLTKKIDHYNNNYNIVGIF